MTQNIPRPVLSVAQYTHYAKPTSFLLRLGANPVKETAPIFAIMWTVSLIACLFAWQAYCRGDAFRPDFALSDIDKFSSGHFKVQQNVCYEYVLVVTEIIEVVSPTSTRDHVTITQAYRGTSPISGAITTTLPPSGTKPGEVVVLTPPVSPSYTTITTAYTGTSMITQPITVTIPPSGGGPGTVLVETPDESPVVITEPYTGTSHITAPITITVPQLGNKPGTVIIEEPPSSVTPADTETSFSEASTVVQDPPGATFSCDTGGFLIQRNTLYRLDLATGENPAIKEHVGTGRNINALGYNILDNFLYAFISTGNNQQQLIRIDSNGDSILLPLILPAGLNVGDVDDNGQFWASARGSKWVQIDLKPGSPTYAKVLGEGVSSGTSVADWVYLENGGDYLYSIRLGATAIAARWSRTTHQWERLDAYEGTEEGHNGFGALYAVGDELWGSDNQTGDIIAFPVLKGGAARKISDGPATDSNDGARCFRAPPPET